ncbi:MAG: helix-turn-helix transcriptional regulator [Thermoanaerobaculia bacterium]|nr:helix-turn-helix transcriptional regulator [Thermoanaerobaculia bacterium]
MRFEGQISKQGRFWAVEVPILGLVTQGKSRTDAYRMVADAIEELVQKPDFSVEVFPSDGTYFEVGSADTGTLMALLLKRQRLLHGVTLAEAASRLQTTSPNTYARYEQGRAKPSVEQLGRLLRAVNPGSDLVLTTSRPRQPRATISS